MGSSGLDLGAPRIHPRVTRSRAGSIPSTHTHTQVPHGRELNISLSLSIATPGTPTSTGFDSRFNAQRK